MKNRVWNHIDFGWPFLKDFSANLPPFLTPSWGPKNISPWVWVRNQFKRFPRGPKSVPRGSKSVPRAAQECSKGCREHSQSVQNAFKWRPRQLQERPSAAKTRKPRWRLAKTAEKLKKTSKMNENIESLSKNGQKSPVWFWEAQRQSKWFWQGIHFTLDIHPQE